VVIIYNGLEEFELEKLQQYRPVIFQSENSFFQYLQQGRSEACIEFQDQALSQPQIQEMPHITVPPQVFFDFLVVVDFEATCHEGNINPPGFIHEIIQFPAVLVNVRKLKIIDESNAFVKPKLFPELSRFCANLTGISTEQLLDKQDFKDVLPLFENWLASHELGTKYTYAIVTDGPFDLGKFLYYQCQVSNIPYFQDAYFWVNLRKCFKCFYRVNWGSLRFALHQLGEEFVGRPHNGLDDARNIATILLRLLRDGCSIVQNEKIILNPHEQEINAYVQYQHCLPFPLRTVQPLGRNEFLYTYYTQINNKGGLPQLQPAIKVEEENAAAPSLIEEEISNTTQRARSRKSRSKSKNTSDQNNQKSCLMQEQKSLDNIPQEE